ncbi:hypothetical protein DES41_106456 [Pseudorhodoferax soli]|uniref:Uncharacterized protein n=1 Tax=Pseudorhodoferax soli TaxID=545864 RepID=A0A368XNK0_9BURK|nr:hypothetical protein DES41_106456 [Pseudorhodoferax soli]
MTGHICADSLLGSFRTEASLQARRSFILNWNLSEGYRFIEASATSPRV